MFRKIWTGFSFTIGPPVAGMYLIGGTLDVLGRPLVRRSKPSRMLEMVFQWILDDEF